MSAPTGELPVGDPVSGGPARRPDRRVREGRYIRLVPVEPDAHVGDLFAGSHGDAEAEALWTYMPYGPFEGVAAMRDWLEAIAASEDPLFLTVLDLTTGSAVGIVSLLAIDPEMRRLELGHIWYVPAAQRTRANTEAVALLLRESFEELGYRRVEWKCDALNRRSRAAAARLGFMFEGVFRRHMVVKGRNRDTAWFAMIAEDWPRIGANIKRWLAAEPGSVSLAELNAADAPVSS